jgi:hypothetical protein
VTFCFVSPELLPRVLLIFVRYLCPNVALKSTTKISRVGRFGQPFCRRLAEQSREDAVALAASMAVVEAMVDCCGAPLIVFAFTHIALIGDGIRIALFACAFRVYGI